MHSFIKSERGLWQKKLQGLFYATLVVYHTKKQHFEIFHA
jgi:hypothetical protein